MVELWWSLIGAAIPAVIAGQVILVKRRRAGERKVMNAVVREKSSNETFVCEKVCTSKRLMKKVGAFSKDPIPDTCVTVCGISYVDVCADACARAVCVNQHQVPNWGDICLRRCQSASNYLPLLITSEATLSGELVSTEESEMLVFRCPHCFSAFSAQLLGMECASVGHFTNLGLQ